MANNFPNILPSLNLDMCNGIYVDPRITFTRAGTRTYYGQEMVKAEENLLLHSQEFDNAYWTKTSTTLSADSAAAPDGTTTADLFYPSSTGVNRLVNRATNIGATASTQYTLSVYAKASGINFLYFGTFGGNTSDANMAFFDLGTGAVGQTGAFFSSASITAVGDGWYRCVATGTTASAAMFPVFGVSDASGDGTVTASGTDGILLWGAQLEQRSFATAYTATTTQPITRYQRQLKTAAANEWPREFDPVTGECLGRSVWESRTNLLTYSEDFTDAAWAKSDSTISGNQLIAPDGTLTADKLIASATTAAHEIVQSITPAAATYTLSFFAKAGEYRYIQCSNTLVGTQFINFDLVGGVVGSSSVYTGTITSVGNGWFRCTATVASAGGTFGQRISLITTLTAVRRESFLGDGYSGIYIWGAMLESGAFATPYTPTVAAQVTRVADSAVMTGVNFSSWFNPEQGCFYVQGSSNNTANARYLMTTATAGDNRFMVYTDGASGITASVTTNGATQALLARTGLTITNNNAFALSYNTDDFKAVGNGGVVGTDTAGVVPVANTLFIGLRDNGASQLSGYIRRLTYYPQALTAANLQAITR